MMFKTHLAFALLLGLVFIKAAHFTFFYIPIVLIAGLLPDIDSSKSYLGNRWYFRPLQWFLKHRGMLHSLSFCFLISLFVSFAYAPLAFPLFIGYFSHLLADSLTKEGIRPFWPAKIELGGKLRTGGKIEIMVFSLFVCIDFILLVYLFFY